MVLVHAKHCVSICFRVGVMRVRRIYTRVVNNSIAQVRVDCVCNVQVLRSPALWMFQFPTQKANMLYLSAVMYIFNFHQTLHGKYVPELVPSMLKTSSLKGTIYHVMMSLHLRINYGLLRRMHHGVMTIHHGIEHGNKQQTTNRELRSALFGASVVSKLPSNLQHGSSWFE